MPDKNQTLRNAEVINQQLEYPGKIISSDIFVKPCDPAAHAALAFLLFQRRILNEDLEAPQFQYSQCGSEADLEAATVIDRPMPAGALNNFLETIWPIAPCRG